MRLYRTANAAWAENDGRWYRIAGAWDDLVNHADLAGHLAATVAKAPAAPAPATAQLLPPIGTQEVWAAGVTYKRSMEARVEESKGNDCYDKVYVAARPELFFKSTPHRAVGEGQKVRIRADSKWNIPEPELALVINRRGEIVGYTVGNDMSSRDIEGENPLYLPQAKVYDQSCAIGPGILMSSAPLPDTTAIKLDIGRAGKSCFRGATTLAQMKRKPRELVDWLFRDNSFPTGCIMLTGTGVVPPSDFSLAAGDVIAITIDGIGTLTNTVG